MNTLLALRRLRNTDLLPYLFLTWLTVALYLVSLPYHIRYQQIVVPMGDPFTYASGFFDILDRSRGNYWGTIRWVFGIGWRHWIQPGLVAILAPILSKAMVSLATTNFVVIWGASLSLFRLARHLGLDRARAYGGALVPWCFPFVYGFEFAGIFITSLDFSFCWLLCIAMCHALILFIDPGRFVNAFMAALTASLAVWGRGNSLPYVLMALSLPLGWGYVRGLRNASGRFRVAGSLVLFIGITVALVEWFYRYNLPAIRAYYAPNVTGKIFGTYGLLRSLSDYSNAPGIVMLGNGYPRDRGLITILSLLSHGLVVGGVLLAWRSRREATRGPALVALALTAAALFYGTFAFLCGVLQVEVMTFGFLPFLCLVSGVTLSAAVILACLPPIPVKAPVAILGLTLGALLYGSVNLKYRMAAWSPRPGVTALEMERFSVELEGILKTRPLAFLWYDVYNRAIVNFYRKKLSLKPLQFYGDGPESAILSDLWRPSHLPDTPIKVERAIRKTLREASFIILPEKQECYDERIPYPLYKNAHLVYQLLHEPGAPRFRTARKLQDNRCQLVMLERLPSQARATRVSAR